MLDLFPSLQGDHRRSTANVLYRVEQNNGSTVALVQADLPPDPDQLPTDYAIVDSIPLTGLLNRLDHNLSVRYRIVANPVAIHTTPDGKKQRRWLRGEDALLWWQRRSTDAGLVTQSVLLNEETLLTGRRDGDQRLKHGATRFEGTATITDPDATRTAILTGIGKARSYGCGLLSVAPLAQE
ncbi:CRISPR system Cascade subunit CasE [Actinokineospora baliensis]|nr:CRISPR system Cascade subunit CasE [Actinokineospora baliensis]